MSNVVVVGAVPAGLAAARRLAARGHEVTVVEAGAECAPRWNGYMEGAVRSGEATADAVAAL